MGLGAVLVDRARKLEPRPKSGEPKMLGRTPMNVPPVASGWFNVRLTIPKSTEEQATGGASGGPRRVRKVPSILFKPLLPDGTPVDLSSTDKLEIDSPQLGHAVWRVQGDPQPIRKRRTVLGYEASLERLDEKPQEPAV